MLSNLLQVAMLEAVPFFSYKVQTLYVDKNFLKMCLYLEFASLKWTFLVTQVVQNLPAMWEARVRSWVGKITCRRAHQPPPVFLPGESHGQRTEQLSTYTAQP